MAYITYKQYDSRWGGKNYNGSSTMATAGCGPTAVAMLAYAVDGKTTPIQTMKFMQKNGYAIRNNGTAWAGIPACMKHFGLKDVKNVSSMADVFAYLSKGYCAVFLFSAGSRGGITWTSAGHYVAVTDYKKKNGKDYLYTRDSGGRGHTGFFCYQTQMRGLISQVWVGKVPTQKKGSYKGEIPSVTVKKGGVGQDVKDVQKFLNWANSGAYMGAYMKKLNVDGVCGDSTVKAIKFYQEIHRLPITGEFDERSQNLARKMHFSGRLQAVNWAVAISKDNSFAYGTGSRAHNYGCYFCGTNITGKKKAKKGSKWEKTYCCNPFIHASYAHGAQNARMLKACRAGGGGGMSPKTWTRYGCFKSMGRCCKFAFSKLKVGDVIISPKRNHVWMYCGGDYLVEASGNSFSADSIARKTGAKKRYNEYRKVEAYVMRYTK